MKINVSLTKARNAPMTTASISWEKFSKRFLDVRPIEKTADEYKELSKDAKLEIKDVGGYVLGTFSDPESRKKKDFKSRSGITLDCDHIKSADHLTELLDKCNELRFECLVASTCSHTENRPRVRIIFPLAQELTDPDQYQALARLLASKIDIDAFDKTTFESARLMFWNSRCRDVVAIAEHFSGAWADPDALLQEYGDWSDMTTWPRTKDEAETGLRAVVDKAEDPREKDGLIGMFCQAYDIDDVIEKFIPDSYKAAGEGRYSYSLGSSSNGAVVYDDGLFLYSHHESDPCYSRCTNAWDLVRLHKFGHLDAEANEKTPPTSLPSSKAMREWAADLVEVRDVAHARSAEDFADLEDPDVLSPDRWVYVSHNDVFFNLHTGVEYTPLALNRAFGRHTPDMNVSKSGRVLNTPKEVTTTDYLLHYKECEVVDEVMYYPQAQTGVFDFDGRPYANKFLASSVPDTDPNWEQTGIESVMREYVCGLVPDYEAEMMIRFMAHNVQFPGKKISWCPLIKGTQGDGKTTLGMILMAVLGRRNVKVITTNEVTSAFNEWAHGACVGIMEEIRVMGHNRHDVMNQLKPLITNEVSGIIPKGRKGFHVFNTQNYIAFTNHADALVIDENDRRWLPMFTHYESRDELVEAGRDANYFKQIYKLLSNQIGAIRGWLLSIDLSDFNPHEAPEPTQARAVMIENSRSNAANSLKAVIDLGVFGVSACLNVVSSQHLNDEIGLNEGRRLGPRSVNFGLAELGYEKLLDRRSVVSGRRTFLWCKPGSVENEADAIALLEQTQGEDFELLT